MHTKKNAQKRELCPVTLKFNRVLDVISAYTFVQNVIKLSAAVRELSCSQRNKKNLMFMYAK